MMITFIGVISIALSLMLFHYVDLQKKMFLLNNFKFSTVTHPSYLNNFKTDSQIDEHFMNGVPYISISEIPQPVNILSILISLNCEACNSLVDDLIDFKFNSYQTAIRLYIVPKSKDYDHVKISSLNILQLSEAYKSDFINYKSIDKDRSFEKISHIAELADYTPKLIYNHNILNYKRSIKDLFFSLS